LQGFDIELQEGILFSATEFNKCLLENQQRKTGRMCGQQHLMEMRIFSFSTKVITMKTKLIMLFIFLLGSGMLSTVHASCFNSLTLGHYVLGDWSGPGPNPDSQPWKVGGVVGSDDRFTTLGQLEAHRDDLIQQCSTKGNEIITEAEGHLTARKNTAGARFDEWCTTQPFCSAVRNISIEYEHNQLDSEIERMKAWYNDNISRCQSNFRYVFNEMSRYLCAAN